MSLTETYCGDIWKYTDSHKIVIPTNCKGVMGAGLAKAARDRYPGLEAMYRKWITLGFHGTEIAYFDHYPDVVLFPTKYHWTQDSDIKLIRHGLEKLATWSHGPYAVPELGCGLGNLKWEDVHLYFEVLRNSPTEFVIVHNKPQMWGGVLR